MLLLYIKSYLIILYTYIIQYVCYCMYVYICINNWQLFSVLLASNTDCYLKFFPRAILLYNSLPPNVINQLSLDDLWYISTKWHWFLTILLHNCIIMWSLCTVITLVMFAQYGQKNNNVDKDQSYLPAVI